MKFGLILGAAAAALTFSAPATAAVIFDLSDVQLVDGGTLTGWLEVSDDLGTLLDFSITSSTNSGHPYPSFTGRTYTFADKTAYTWNTTQGLWSQFGDPFAQLNIFVVKQLTGEGGSLAVTTSETQTTGTRWLTKGDLVARQAGVVPEPATWAMLIAGFGLVGASMRRRSRTAVLSN